MSETLLSNLPQTVCTEIKTYLPKLKECRPHAGKFDITELKKEGLKAPGVLVSMLGAKQDVTYAGAYSFNLKMAAYVVTRDGLGVSRDVAAANICQTILMLVPGQTWNSRALGEAREVTMHTLVSSKSRDHAVSLWAVTWDQPVSFFEPLDLPLGVELYVSQSPEIGAAHEADYERIGGDV